MKEVYVKTRQKWRDWLAKHHRKEQAGIWLVFYKKAARKPSLVYEEAVEEALCFGWIDSIIKRKDGARFVGSSHPARQTASGPNSTRGAWPSWSRKAE